MKLGTLKVAFGMALVLAVTASPAFARQDNDDTFPVSGVPEIAVGSLASAATLLTGGYLVLRSRIGRKK